ncbi:uncharacterized protein LOC124811074 isoform X2 [Hydra vulgaris]|uniref:Uncharacterized protein LOC124811074 isoform X2 n=1 Tax=Hydra vulgaris TaxID=6087 RepID=A0ABM4CGG3_HYDVU
MEKISFVLVLFVAMAMINCNTNCPDCPKPQPTGTPIPTPACTGDVCKTSSGFREGSFRNPLNPGSFVTCYASNNADGFDFRCGVCYPPLYFSEKCQSCEYNLLDSENICFTTESPKPAPTTDYVKDFCKNMEKDGNYADVVHTSYFYACVDKETYHMYCGDINLYYNATCDACMWRNCKAT